MTRLLPRVFSIRWIVTGLAATLTAAAVVSVSFVSERNARVALTSELQTRLLLEARSLAQASAPALLNEFPELTLHPLVREKVAREPELSFAVVIDHSGMVQGDPNPQRLGTQWNPPGHLRPLPPAATLAPGERLSMSPEEMVATVPVVHASGRAIGEVVMGIRTSYLERAVTAARRQHAAVLAFFLILGVAASFAVVSHVLKPVEILRAGIERIAKGDLETPIKMRDRTELGLLSDAINDMCGRLKQAQAEMMEQERLAHELDLARDLQRSLLPAERTVAGPFILEGAHFAAAEVGGDYYDYFPLPDGRIGFAVADVSGKGLGGCLVMSMLSALLRANRGTTTSPAAVLAALDEQLSESLPSGTFVTMFYGILDPRSGRLTHASAGHNPTFVYRRATGEIEQLQSRGIPIGAIRGGAIRSTLQDQVIELGPGDALVQYTDGISEAFDPTEKDQFGYERMAAVLRQKADQGPRAVLSGLHEAVSAWTGGVSAMDDETLLVVYRDPDIAAPPAASTIGAAAATVARPTAAALARYEEASRRGVCVRFAARADVLQMIQGWMAATPLLAAIPSTDAELLRTTLYEVCSNVAEHGYQADPDREIEVWWIPPPGAPEDIRSAAEAARLLRAGEFLIRDHGAPFDASEWKGKDFGDPQVRKHGRGLGLEIIHRVMQPVRYNPATSQGNITIMKFGDTTNQIKEVRHA